jgi:hypothetical protein
MSSSEDILQRYGFKDVEHMVESANESHKKLMAKLDPDDLASLLEAQKHDVRDVPDFFAGRCLGNGRVEGTPSGVGLQSSDTCYVYAVLSAILNCGDLAERMNYEICQRYDLDPLSESDQQLKVKDIIGKLFDVDDKVNSDDVNVMIGALRTDRQQVVRDMLLAAVLTLAKENGAHVKESIGQDAMYALLTYRFTEGCATDAHAFIEAVQGGKVSDVLLHVIGMHGFSDHRLNHLKMFPATSTLPEAVLVAKDHVMVSDAPVDVAARMRDMAETTDKMFDQAGVMSFMAGVGDDMGHAVAYARDADGSIFVIDSNFRDPVPLSEYPPAAVSHQRMTLSLSPCPPKHLPGGGLVQAARSSVRPYGPYASRSRALPKRTNVTASASDDLYTVESLLYLLMLRPYWDRIDGTILCDELHAWLNPPQGGGRATKLWAAWAAMAAVVLASAMSS